MLCNYIAFSNICKKYSTYTWIIDIINYILFEQRLAQLDKKLKAREGKKNKKDAPSSSLPTTKKSRRK